MIDKATDHIFYQFYTENSFNVSIKEKLDKGSAWLSQGIAEMMDYECEFVMVAKHFLKNEKTGFS